jgi:putative restriction endonuclease
MANAWVICPYNADYPDLLQAIWEAGLKQSFISIGWPKVGDATGKSREAIQAVVDRVYSPRMSQGGRSIWTFLNEIQVGDTIVARSDLSHVLGMGRVVRKGFYDPALCAVGANVDAHYLFVGVEWDASFAPRLMPSPKYFLRGTLHRLSAVQLAEIRSAVGPVPPPKTSSKPWSRDDLLVAMHLYCQLTFGQFHSRNPTIISIAAAMGRSPSSLAMKLCNLASLDLSHQARGVVGLKGASQADREVWAAFQADWEGMAAASATAMEQIAPTAAVDPQVPTGPTESTAMVRVRRGQDFFRATVLTAYGRRCCLTGCDVEDFLVASHIVPWAEDAGHRLNPRNGLCLAPLQDRAFDRGFIGLDDDLRVLVSRQLRLHEANTAVRAQLVGLEGARIQVPDRFVPDVELVRRHRATVFAGRN